MWLAHAAEFELSPQQAVFCENGLHIERLAPSIWEASALAALPVAAVVALACVGLGSPATEPPGDAEMLSNLMLETQLSTLPELTATAALATDFEIADYGATGDGTTDDGPAIQKAVDRTGGNRARSLRAYSWPLRQISSSRALPT